VGYVGVACDCVRNRNGAQLSSYTRQHLLGMGCRLLGACARAEAATRVAMDTVMECEAEGCGFQGAISWL
jgi:hypothetical protein